MGCLNCDIGKYYIVDSWIEDDGFEKNKGNSVYIVMCYDCHDTIWIEKDKNNVIVEIKNMTEPKK